MTRRCSRSSISASISTSAAACSASAAARSARSTTSRSDLAKGEVLGLVGESGSGKSTLAAPCCA